MDDGEEGRERERGRDREIVRAKTKLTDVGLRYGERVRGRKRKIVRE